MAYNVTLVRGSGDSQETYNSDDPATTTQLIAGGWTLKRVQVEDEVTRPSESFRAPKAGTSDK